MFFSEAVSGQAVWSIADDQGHPAPVSGDGKRSIPFWSKESRAARVVDHVDAYRDFKVVRIDLDAWKSRWLPGMTEDGLLVGLNWSGERATGFDVEPADAKQRLAHTEAHWDSAAPTTNLLSYVDGQPTGE